MSAMKILITGGNGLLGQYLNLQLSANNEILTTYYRAEGNCRKFKSAKININNHIELESIFKEFQPTTVIHTAAISSPELAEKHSAKEVYKTNVFSTQKIAELCEKYKSKLIYTSTDLVYAGYRGSMLREEARLIPISMYAETKLMGEVKIHEVFDNFIILRLALLLGFGLNGKKNHFHKMYMNLKEGTKVKLFYDQYRTPLSLLEASRMIGEICRLDIKTEVINFGGLERLSRYDVGKILCKAANFDINLLEKISMNDVPDFPQVADVSMNTDKLQSYGIKAKGIEESIREILNSIRI
jgi:dTDP-4-dehydrorhamnose reductase